MTVDKLYEKKRAKLKELEEALKVEDAFDSAKVDGVNGEIIEIDKQIRSLKEAQNQLLTAVESVDREFPATAKKKEYVPLRDRLDQFFRGVILTPSGDLRAVNINDELPLIPAIEESGNYDFITKKYNWDAQDTKLAKFAKSPEARGYDWNKTDATGGYLVPDEMANQIATAQAFIGGMVTPGLCKWLRTSTGRVIEIPTVNDTAVYAAVVAGSTAMTSGTVPTYGQGSITFYKITSHIATIANELVQDAAFDVVSHVLELLSLRVARGLNRYFTIGTGSSQPYGIQVTATKGVAANPRTLTRANIVDLIYSVNRAYRSGAAFQMEDATVGYIRKLAKSATYLENQPVWQDSMRDGEPIRLEGFPVVVNAEMDEINAYNQSVFFGDWQRFWIAEALPMKVVRMEEYYKPSDQLGFAILGRWGSALAAISGDAPIKYIRHSST